MWDEIDEMKDDEAMHFQEIGSIFAHFSLPSSNWWVSLPPFASSHPVFLIPD